MAVWSVMAAPLMMSVDLDTIRDEFKEILLNDRVIKIDQDELGKQGMRVWNRSKCEVIIMPIIYFFIFVPHQTNCLRGLLVKVESDAEVFRPVPYTGIMGFHF